MKMGFVAQRLGAVSTARSQSPCSCQRSHTLSQQRVVCFLDFDNTLFDNDGLKADINQQLSAVLSAAQVQRFWMLYEQTRHAEGTVDFPATMDLFRPEIPSALAERVWSIIWDYPFATKLFPSSLSVLVHLTALGMHPSIVSDGDPLYQPHKIALSGVTVAVHERVKVFIHKQQHLAEVLAWQPADHYIMVDDKAQILADFQRMQPGKFTTVHVKQGHYADSTADPAPDIQIAHISDLLEYDLDRLTQPVK